jgi:hypothetical protein
VLCTPFRRLIKRPFFETQTSLVLWYSLDNKPWNRVTPSKKNGYFKEKFSDDEYLETWQVPVG